MKGIISSHPKLRRKVVQEEGLKNKKGSVDYSQLDFVKLV